MNLAEQISRHQVPNVWMPSPVAHLQNPRDRFHFEWALRQLLRLQKSVYYAGPIKFLDVGCYDGWLDFLLLSWPGAGEDSPLRPLWVGHGLELIPNLCASARAYARENGIGRYLTIEGSLCDSVTKVDFDYNSILCLEVLEHIPLEEVPDWLSQMELICKKNGYILISLPDQRQEDNHQHQWTPTSNLIQLLFSRKKGFQLEYQSYPGTSIPGNFLISYLS